jgi:hypothetical protein
VFEDDDTTGYLYLTRPDEPAPAADCWLYNRIPAPGGNAIDEYMRRGVPPPVIVEYAGPDAQYTGRAPDVRFVWTSGGEAVACEVDGTVLGFIALNESERGFSRHLLRESAWGHPWNEELYSRIFEDERAQ